jgi:hypothetical protein
MPQFYSHKLIIVVMMMIIIKNNINSANLQTFETIKTPALRSVGR